MDCRGKMNVNDSRIVMVCFIFFMLFFLYKRWIWIYDFSPLVTLSSISRPHPANLTTTEEAVVQSPMASPISCYTSYGTCHLCSISTPTVLDPKVVTFYDLGPTNLLEKDPQKRRNFTTARIKDVTITSGPIGPSCMVQHKSPALLFSATGDLCTGNFFHAFNDGFIPLFITINSFFPNDQDRVLVISTSCNWWVRKYVDLLQSFSKHPIVVLNNDTATHCFPSAMVGLVSHGFMTIEPNLMPNSQKLLHFHAQLKKAYGSTTINHPPTTSISPISTPLNSRPRLVLAIRSNGSKGRVISNQVELRKAAEEEGFNVIEFEPKVEAPLSENYKLISSSHVLVGVHGAALTNLLFLRPGSVVVQVVPLGLEWLAGVCFGKPAREVGLEYMEYKIGVEESSLKEKYEKDDLVLKDPFALQWKGWNKEIMNVYLVEQNVKLDEVRFRRYLKKAYEKARVFMEKEG